MRPTHDTTPTSRLWRSRGPDTIELARIEYAEFAFEPHFHEHYVIMLVEDGVNIGQRGPRAYEVASDEMLIIPPGETHAGSSRGGTRLRYLAFYPDPESVTRWLEAMEMRPESASDLAFKYTNPGVSSRFRRLFRAVSADESDPLDTQTALLEFFGGLLAAQPASAHRPRRPATDSERFRKARAFIEDNFAESFSLAELAASAGSSPYHLIRVFRGHTGLTPFGYLRSLRVEKAKGYLRAGASLTDVAYRAGFYDQSHFIRCFKNHTGFLPSRFSPRGGARR